MTLVQKQPVANGPAANYEAKILKKTNESQEDKTRKRAQADFKRHTMKLNHSIKALEQDNDSLGLDKENLESVESFDEKELDIIFSLHDTTEALLAELAKNEKAKEQARTAIAAIDAKIAANNEKIAYTKRILDLLNAE
jgi:hypothetical protein